MTPLTYEEWQEMEDIKRETQRRCRHRRSRAVHQALVIERSVGEWVANGVEKRVCTRCWAWLPLGPASPAPATELLLADQIADTCQLWEPKHQDTRIQVWVDLISTHTDGEAE